MRDRPARWDSAVQLSTEPAPTRRSARANAAASIGQHQGFLFDVTASAARFESPTALARGQGVEVELRLPAGALIRMLGDVEQVASGAGAFVHELALAEAIGPNAAFFEEYVRHGARAERLGATLSGKYLIKDEGPGHISALLRGMLHPSEGEHIRRAVERALAKQRKNLRLELDVRELSVLSQETLRKIREMVRILSTSDMEFGLMVGVPSLALNQLVRLIRECSLADKIFVTHSLDEAERLWKELAE